jgi:imidazolonepropionase-like amidohydrolase
MRPLVSLAAVLLLTAAPQPQRTVLRFGHLWDGARLLDDVAVVVEGDRLASVTGGQRGIAPGAVDLRRYTAIPGLIDLHTHITYYWNGAPGTRPLG